MRDFTRPGRSTAIATSAMATTSSPAATLAALDVLKNGGNAVDAAITASAVLCITEPHMTGIGGDCFAIITKPDGTMTGLNGAGRSAAAATDEWLSRSGLTSIDPHSVHAVTVPGAIDAWDKLLKAYGSFSLGDCLEPAIRLAEKGLPTSPRVAFDWPESLSLLQQNAGARTHYLRNGKTPARGDVMVYPALAKTLRAIARNGRDEFYCGEIASDMLAELAAAGSLLRTEDYQATCASWVTPVSTAFAGLNIHEIPPSGQGLTVLITLNILSQFDLAKLDPFGAQRRHLEIEALKRAWVLRNRHIADPDMANVPTAELLGSRTAQSLAATIDPRRAAAIDVKLSPSDTVYLSVVDHNRMAVSFINSIYWHFGSGLVTQKSGITLQNRGAGFVTDPAHPNCIGPAKRPLHTIIPAVATKGDKTEMVFGVMGGDFQPMGHVNTVLNRYIYDLDLQENFDLPRLVPDNGRVQAEDSMPGNIVRELRKMGHDIFTSPEPLGGGQAIAIDHQRGILLGASDPRKDGFAAGLD
jgi:gamma-glutamyltranspeptidase / glutathione hydrolase